MQSRSLFRRADDVIMVVPLVTSRMMGDSQGRLNHSRILAQIYQQRARGVTIMGER